MSVQPVPSSSLTFFRIGLCISAMSCRKVIKLLAVVLQRKCSLTSIRSHVVMGQDSSNQELSAIFVTLLMVNFQTQITQKNKTHSSRQESETSPSVTWTLHFHYTCNSVTYNIKKQTDTIITNVTMTTLTPSIVSHQHQ